MQLRIQVILLSSIALLWVGGCGKKSQKTGGSAGQSEDYVFTGQITLAEDLELLAVPLIEGEPSTDSVILAQSAQIQSNGVFSLGLPSQFTSDELIDLLLTKNDEYGTPESMEVGNWVFILQNKVLSLNTLTPTERLGLIHSFVGIPDDKNSLINIPTSNITKNTQPMNLGEIQKVENGFANSSARVEDTVEKFNRSLWELQEIASTNDPLRNLKNLMANYDAETKKYYSAEPFFIWNANQSLAVSQFSNASALSVGGFGIYFNSNDSRVSLDAICAPKSNPSHISVAIYPPANVTGRVGSSDVVFNSNNPMTNESTTGATPSGNRHECYSGTLYASGKVNSDEAASFNVGGGGFSTAMPEGIWTLTLDGDEAAAFDLAAASPHDEDGNPLVYTPSIKINKNSSDVITSIDIAWYRYNKSTQTLDEVTDLSVFKNTVQNLSVELIDYSGIDSNSARIEESLRATEPNLGATYNFSGWNTAFKIGSSSDTTSAVAESITVRYKIYGVNVRFDYR